MGWPSSQARFGSSDAIPLWVADMDFRSPEPVVAALPESREHGIYGYTMATDGYYQAMIDWLSRRQGWQVEREWISHAPGVVPGLGFLLLALTEPGDKVIIQTPVYYPFKRVIEAHGRTVLANPLQYKDGRYEMDLEDLARKVDGAKVLILSNPHNPVGRVWMREELEGLGDVCAEAGVVVISDEIHADLVFKPYRHTPLASISDKLAQNSVTCIAPSKTFNLAGFHTAKDLSEGSINFVYAVLATIAALMMFVPKKGIDDVELHTVTFNRVIAVVSALIVGGLSGIVGAAGAFILVPVMLLILRIPTRMTIASSLAITFISSIGATIGKVMAGDVVFGPALVMVISSIIAAPLGARLSKRIHTKVLQTILAALILAHVNSNWVDIAS